MIKKVIRIKTRVKRALRIGSALLLGIAVGVSTLSPAAAQLKRLADLPVSNAIQGSLALSSLNSITSSSPNATTSSASDAVNSHLAETAQPVNSSIPQKNLPQEKGVSPSDELFVEVPVLAHLIPIDHIINADDIHFIQVPSRQISRKTVLKIEDLLGNHVRPSAARPDRPLKRSDLQRPQLIKRGQTVALRVHQGALQIESMAKALENGEKGQNIRLLNTQSNRAIHATVTGLGQAEISLIKPLILTEGNAS